MELSFLIGIKLENNEIVSLLNEKELEPKILTVVMNKGESKELPVLIYKKDESGKIVKAYLIGKIKIAEIEESNVQLESSMNGDGVLQIKVYTKQEDVVHNIAIYSFEPDKILKEQTYEENEQKCLEYGDFEKTYPSDSLLLAEEDISDSVLVNVVSGEKLEKDDEKKAKKEQEDDYYDLVNNASRPRVTISAKLICIISLIVISALGSITYLVSRFVSDDVLRNAESSNLSANAQSVHEVEEKLMTISKNSVMVWEILDTQKKPAELEGLDKVQDTDYDKIVKSFFENNTEIISVLFPNGDKIVNQSILKELGISAEKVNKVCEEKKDKQKSLQNPDIENLSQRFEVPVCGLFYPLSATERNEALLIIFSLTPFSEMLGTNAIYSSFMINKDGNVLASPNDALVLGNENLLANPVVADFYSSGKNNSQIRFDSDGVNYYGAYKKLSVSGSAVVTVVPTSIVLAAVNKTTYRNLYLTVAVLALSILLIWIFSKRISNPIKALATAATKIKDGDFSLTLKPHTHDELGLLTQSFVSMSNGLKERERLKDTFGRFTNKAVAEKAMKGELELGGENKIATIFFSDIRSFTAISESLSPSEVVEFLNDYMTRMVQCITKTGGTVDKYIGDAIMAIWGVPLSTGTPKEDALNAVKAALMMRAALIEFNKTRGGPKKPIIRIGCGINTGSLIAGQIGSVERMEYTCIGDSVNVASRTESLNKPLGTDILITEDTYLLVKDEVTVEQMPSVSVKGKSKPVDMYAVINMPNVEDIPLAGSEGFTSLEEIRKELGIPEPNLDGVDLNAEEQKYQIKSK